jgi:hypothetical protein
MLILQRTRRKRRKRRLCAEFGEDRCGIGVCFIQSASDHVDAMTAAPRPSQPDDHHRNGTPG